MLDALQLGGRMVDAPIVLAQPVGRAGQMRCRHMPQLGTRHEPKPRRAVLHHLHSKRGGGVKNAIMKEAGDWERNYDLSNYDSSK